MITLYKIGNSDNKDYPDNFRTDCNYTLVPIGRPILNREMWYHDSKDKNLLFHTEIITKVGFGFLKSKKCKYIIQQIEG